MNRANGYILSLLATVAVAGCGGNDGNTSASATTPRVGQVWYVIDHAYTSEVYNDIKQSGPDAYPAQTSGDKPDRSYHLARPYPCKVIETGDDGFYKCDVDSEQTLDVKVVWTNRLLSKEQAEAVAPGTVVHKSEPSEPRTPAWLKMKPGLHLYTGYDGGDATTVAICPDRTTYKKDSSGDAQSSCKHRKPGIPVHIVSISNDYSLDGTTNFPILKITADDGSWTGYTSSMLGVQPKIPIGAILVTEKKPMNNARSKIWTHKTDSYESGIEVEDSTRLQLLREDPTDAGNSTLYVKVLTGRYAGRTGWTLNDHLYMTSGVWVNLTL